MKSIEIFKQIISNHIPEYKFILDEAVLRDAKLFFTDSDSGISGAQGRGRAKFTESYIYEADSEINEPTLKQQLRIKEIDLNEIIDEFLGDLAQLYIEEPESSDPIISFLLTSNNSEFLEQLEFAKELKQAFHRIERQEKKAQLKKVKEQEEDEVIRAAFHRIERAEKKKLLQELEESEILKPTGSDYASYSMNQEQEYQSQIHKIVSTKKQIPWKFVIRIAAVLILVLIPVGISILFFDDGGTVLPKGKENGGKPKEGEKIIYAETGDLTEIKRINIPLPKVDNLVSKIENNEPSFGFAKQEDKVAISVIFTGDQINYLAEKITLLEQKIKELKTKNIKDKDATLKSLKEITNKCTAEMQVLISKQFQYDFDDKTFNLTIYSSKKIDLKSLKVYSIENEESNNGYYLRIKDQYFYLNKSGGKLSIVLNNEIIEILSLY